MDVIACRVQRAVHAPKNNSVEAILTKVLERRILSVGHTHTRFACVKHKRLPLGWDQREAQWRAVTRVEHKVCTGAVGPWHSNQPRALQPVAKHCVDRILL
jgi:hypothetical protein